MAHRFDYSDSDVGVYTAFDYLFLSMEFEPMIISNSLFLGAGQTTGSVTWPGGAGTVTQDSHLGSNGAITTGVAPDPLFSRATLPGALPATFNAPVFLSPVASASGYATAWPCRNSSIQTSTAPVVSFARRWAAFVSSGIGGLERAAK